MYEKLPPISPEDIEGAWNAALRANSAYDGWQIAKNPEEEALATATAEGMLSISVVGDSVEARIRITSFKIGGVALSAEVATDEQDDEVVDELVASNTYDESNDLEVEPDALSEVEAEEKFRQLSNVEILGRVMLGEDSPFDISSNSEETYSLVEVEPTNSEVFESLEYDYRKEAIDSFDMWSGLISTAVEQGAIPPDYLLDPDDERLQEQAIALYLKYEEMKADGLEPEIVFVPRSLNSSQWNYLLNGYLGTTDSQDIGRDVVMNGYDSSFSESMNNDSGPLWDLAVISGIDYSSNSVEDVDSLLAIDAQEVPEHTITSSPMAEGPRNSLSEDVSTQTVSLDAYYALQLSRLVRRENVIDSDEVNEIWTLLSDNIEVDGVTHSLIARIDPVSNEVVTSLVSGTERQDEIVIRPSIMGKDILNPDKKFTSEFGDDEVLELQY